MAKLPTWDDIVKTYGLQDNYSDTANPTKQKQKTVTWDDIVYSYSQTTSPHKYFVTWDSFLDDFVKQSSDLTFAEPPKPKIETKPVQKSKPSLGETFVSGLKKGILDTAEGLINFGRTVTLNLAKVFGLSDDEVKNFDQQTSQKLVSALGFGGTATKGLGAIEEMSAQEGKAATQALKSGNLLEKATAVIGETLPQIAMIGITRSAGGSLSKALNLGAKATETVEKVSTLAPLGISAAGQYARQAELEGASPQKQLLYGLIGGTAEALTEMIPLEQAMKFGSSIGKNLIKSGAKTFSNLGEVAVNFLKTVGSEAAQEAFVDVPVGIAHKLIVNPQQPWFGEGGAIDVKQMGQDAFAGAVIGTLFAGLGLPEAFKSHQMAQDIIQEINDNAKKKYKPVITQGTWRKIADLQDTIQEEINNNPDIVEEHLNRQLGLAQTELETQTQTQELANEQLQQTAFQNLLDEENLLADLTAQRENLLNRLNTLKELRDNQGLDVIPQMTETVRQLTEVEKQIKSANTLQGTFRPVNIQTQEAQITTPTETTTAQPQETVSQTVKTQLESQPTETTQQQEQYFTGRTPDLGAQFGTGTSTEKVPKAEELVEIFRKRLGLTIKKGKITKPKAEGIYKPHEDVIRLKIWNDMPVLAHEVGHWLEKNENLELSDAAKQKIMDIGVKYYQDRNQIASPQQAYSEGFAEFIRQYLFDEVKDTDLVQEFENSLSVNTRNVLLQVKNYVNKLIEADPESLVEATISKEPNAKIKKKSFTEAFREFMLYMFDRYYPIEELAKKTGTEQDYQSIINKLRGYTAQAMYSLETKQIDLEGNEVGKSLKEILDQIKPEDYKHFVNYVVARAAEDYYNNGLVLPLPYRVYEETRAKLESQYPEFAQIFDEVKEYANRQLDMLVEAGLYSKEEAEAMKAKYPNYMPFYRDLSYLGYSGNKPSQGRVLKQRRGGGEDVIDPIESIVMREFWFRKAANNNLLKRYLADLADDKEGLGEWIEKVPAHKQAFTISKETLMQILKKEGIDIDADQLNQDFYKIFMASHIPAKNEIVVYRNGEAELYEVNDLLYQALTEYSPPEGVGKLAFTILNTLKKTLQTGVVTNIAFIARNMMRDTFGAMVYSKSGINFLDILRGYISAFRKDEWYQLFVRYGGQTEWLNEKNRKALQTYYETIMPRSLAQKALTFLKHPVAEIHGLIEFTEAGPRIAEFRKALEKMGLEKDEAVALARDLTIDFNKAGKLGRQLNAIIPFFNPQAQGIYKLARALKEPKTWIKASLYITVPFIVNWLLLRDNEEYQSMTPWRKYFCLNIPLGAPDKADKFFSIPLPYDLVFIFGSLPIALLDQINKKDPQAIERWAKQFWNALGLDFWNIAGIQTWVRLASNRQWTGAPIENLGDLKLLPKYRYDEKTSTLSKELGQLLNVSPKKLDYAVKELFGTLGEELWRLPDVLTGKQKSLQGTTAGRFITKPLENPVEVQDFYDEYKKMEQLYYSSKREGKAIEGFDSVKWERLKAAYKLIDKIEEALKENEKTHKLTQQQIDNLRAWRRFFARKALGYD